MIISDGIKTRPKEKVMSRALFTELETAITEQSPIAIMRTGFAGLMPSQIIFKYFFTVPPPSNNCSQLHLQFSLL